MLDLGNLIANGLWILGCALGLATFSYASWQASISHEKLFARLKQLKTLLFLDLSGVLICLGAAFIESTLWVKGLWFVLAALFLVYLGSIIKSIDI